MEQWPIRSRGFMSGVLQGSWGIGFALSALVYGLFYDLIGWRGMLWIGVLPAFTVSELATAFQIGFLIFLPFLVIDLVVANILMAMGMQMLTPTTVSLPFKLLLFVLVDGWVKLAHGLVLSYL
jgi:MFS family permease